MQYVISDIHGCYREYRKLLDKIQFSDKDTLYVLGDVVDRGPEPLKVLEDMSMRPNVIPIIGNHEYMALSVLPKLFLEDTKENIEQYFTVDFLKEYQYWMNDGGKITVEQFSKLDAEDREFYIEYLEDFELYREVYCDDKRYILVHADIAGEDKNADLDSMDVKDLIFTRADYDRCYSDAYKLITGHTPTFLIDPQYEGQIYRKNNHIAIDCGCVYEKSLGVYCIETGECFYIKKE